MTTATQAATKTGVLQMVRAQINAREFRRWMGEKRLQDPDHAMHCLLTECFGRPPTKERPENDGLAPQPFRLILPRDGSNGVLYGYGRSDADALREMAAVCADPLQSRILPGEKLDTKSMPTLWQVGKQFGFETRIRPVVRRSRNAAERPEKECDVFLWEALQHPEKERMKRSREEVYAEWLSAQLGRTGGASLDASGTKLVAFQRVRAFRKLNGRHSEGPDAVMRGSLTITDPDAFATLLSRGIGRHRAYGYGMLLLRPARA